MYLNSLARWAGAKGRAAIGPKGLADLIGVCEQPENVSRFFSLLHVNVVHSPRAKSRATESQYFKSKFSVHRLKGTAESHSHSSNLKITKVTMIHNKVVKRQKNASFDTDWTSSNKHLKTWR